jgi:hypothetical protein
VPRSRRFDEQIAFDWLDPGTLFASPLHKDDPLLVHDFSADPEEVAMTLDRRLQAQHVAGWIASGALAYVTGDNGIGKSWLSAKLAVATAAGRPGIGWFGADGEIVRHGNVLWVAGELSSAEDYKRQTALMRGLGITTLKHQIIYINRTEWPPFRFNGSAEPYHWKLLVKAMPRFALVILDPVNVVVGIDDENNNNEVRDLIMQLRHYATQGAGPTIVLTGHPGKSYKGKAASDVIRAAGSWRDVDQIISVRHVWVNPTKTDRIDRVEHAKQNVSGMPTHPPMTFAITAADGAVTIAQTTRDRRGRETEKEKSTPPGAEPERHTYRIRTAAAETLSREEERNISKILHYGERLGTATADAIGAKAGLSGRAVRNYMQRYQVLKDRFEGRRTGGTGMGRGRPWTFTFSPPQ